jgi:hypothetical protein
MDHGGWVMGARATEKVCQKPKRRRIYTPSNLEKLKGTKLHN